MIEQRRDVSGEGGRHVTFLRRLVRLVGVGVAAHVWDDDLEALGQRADVEMPFVVEAGPAVDEEQRRAGAFADVVITESVYRGVFVLETVGLRGQAGCSFEGEV